jgi:hypothetical protein
VPIPDERVVMAAWNGAGSVAARATCRTFLALFTAGAVGGQYGVEVTPTIPGVHKACGMAIAAYAAGVVEPGTSYRSTAATHALVAEAGTSGLQNRTLDG